MRKFLSVWLALVLAVSVAGCSATTLQKKFTRKKKQPKHTPAVIFTEGEYQKKFSNEYYYKTHYTFWKSWTDDWLDQLGGNEKKVRRCAQETVNHLTEIHRYLTPETQARLTPELEATKKVADKINRGVYSKSDIGPIRVELERIKRVVQNNFYFEKVKEKIVPDTVDLGAVAETEAEPSPVP